MQVTKKQRTQLIVNISLMLLTLFTLVACIFAWFFSEIHADIDPLGNQVDRYFSGGTTDIVFPCATKITDDDITPEIFDNVCAVARTYKIYGEGQVRVKVKCNGAGMLAYVCDSAELPNSQDKLNYYDEICAALTEKLGADKTKWTYDAMRTALEGDDAGVVGINSSKLVGSDYEGDAYVTVVYWVEYDKAFPYLENVEVDEDTDGLPDYWYSAMSNSGTTYFSQIDFIFPEKQPSD